MLSITRNASNRNFDYRFDADAFARSKGFEDEKHFNRMADLIAACHARKQLRREINAHKARIAVLEAELKELRR